MTGLCETSEDGSCPTAGEVAWMTLLLCLVDVGATEGFEQEANATQAGCRKTDLGFRATSFLHFKMPSSHSTLAQQLSICL